MKRSRAVLSEEPSTGVVPLFCRLTHEKKGGDFIGTAEEVTNRMIEEAKKINPDNQSEEELEERGKELFDIIKELTNLSFFSTENEENSAELHKPLKSLRLNSTP